MPDELMKACAATGGVQCINGFSHFLGGDALDPENLFRHIDYACELIGADHVGLGLDFIFDTERNDEFGRSFDPAEKSDYWPKEHYEGVVLSAEASFAPEQLPQLTECMLTHGYDASTIRGILGGNMMRIARKVWR
ncbi:MAG: membrane dipeptidase [Pseudomonadota bacterium]